MRGLSLKILMLLLAISWQARAQQITGLEYFLDTEPGLGNGTQVAISTPSDSVDFNFSIDLTGVSTGFHKLYIRSFDNNNHYSIKEGRAFYVIAPNDLAAPPSISQAEFFFDTDPGIGNGTSITFNSAADSVDQTFAIDASGLTSGFHKLYIRAFDGSRYSLKEGRSFYIIESNSLASSPQVASIEYFVDTDPGVGNGTSLSFNSAADSVDQTFAIDVTGIEPGFHKLYVRAIDAEGNSSVKEGRSFYVIEGADLEDSAPIARAEYFINTDPGIGNGTSLAIENPGDSIEQSFTIDLTGQPLGTDTLYIRVFDEAGVPSLYQYGIYDILENVPPVLADTTYLVDENISNDSRISVLDAFDADGDELEYSFHSGDTSALSLNATSGELLVIDSSKFDYESLTSFSFEVMTKDTYGNETISQIIIEINDVNEAPYFTGQTDFTIDENVSSETQVGTLNASDPEGDSLYFSITAGNIDEAFAIDSLGAITVLDSAALDYETNPLFELTVEISDGEFAVSQLVTITLNDIDEGSPPTDIILSNDTIEEGNTSGDIVGTFSSTDPDVNDTHTYSFVSGTGDADNASFTINGSDLLAAEVFDASAKSSYSIRVQTDDNNGGTYSKEFVITISEAKENQSITFDALADKTFGDVDFELTATASSGLEVTYTSSDENVATVNGSTVTITGAGTTTIIASQAGDENYSPAEDVEQTLTVNKADQSITIEAIADKLVDDQAFDVIATTSSGLDLTYNLEGPATISGTTITLDGIEGTVTVTVSQRGDENYNAASATESFDVISDPCINFDIEVVNLVDVLCNGEASGSFEVTATGTAPYIYTLNGNDQESNQFTDLTAGNYELIVTDANDCNQSLSVTINEPEAISVSAEIENSTSIFGNGSITVSATGGTGTLSYEWSTGASIATLSDLLVGEYSVTVTDENNCSITESFTVGGVTASNEALSEKVLLYPNPTSSAVKILHAESVENIKLYDAHGKLLLVQKTSNSESNLEMASFPAGLYFIQLDNSVTMHRIMKK